MKKIFVRKMMVPVKPQPVQQAGLCLNCNTKLSADDQYCSNCGQKRFEREDMSIRALFQASFLNYFHFDSKFFRTILPLLYKPGLLTHEFMQGKRKSYVEPFKLFLIISLIYFIVLPLGNDEKENVLPANQRTEQEQFSLTLQGIPLSKSGRDSIKNKIDSIGFKNYFDQNFANEPYLTRLFLKRALKIMISTGQSFTTVVEHTASKMIFLLIPVFAALLKLFYLRRNRLYFEHLIFSFHLHSFIFLLLILYLIIDLLFPVNLAFIILIILIYFFMGLKNYYGQSIGRTLVKMLLTSFSYIVICIPVFVLLLILVSMFTF